EEEGIATLLTAGRGGYLRLRCKHVRKSAERCSTGHEAVDAAALARRKTARASRCKPYCLYRTGFAGIAAIIARMVASLPGREKAEPNDVRSRPVFLLGFDNLQTGKRTFRVNRTGRRTADTDTANQRVADLDRQTARLDNEAGIHVPHAVIGWLRSDEFRKLARIAAESR